MKKIQLHFICFLLACMLPIICGCRTTHTDSVFQISTIPALMQGVYDSEATWQECKKHGDTGLGTFNGLDGEMVVIDGGCYKVKHSGAVEKMPDDTKTPFLTVTFFDTDITTQIPSGTDITNLKNILDTALVSQNYPWCVRIDGIFAHVKTRSVEKQTKPYPVLTEAVKNQSLFTFENIRGSIVGFRFPEYANGVNVPGWHLHFISDDRTRGGHLLEVLTGPDCRAGLDKCTAINTILPDTSDFSRFSYSTDSDDALKKVESPS